MEKTLDLNELGYRIKRLREERGFTQSELAEACGVKQAQVSGWELGKNLPNLESLLVLCHNLGVSLTDFLGEKSPTSAPPRKPDKYEMALWIIQAIGVEGFRLEQVKRFLTPNKVF